MNALTYLIYVFDENTLEMYCRIKLIKYIWGTKEKKYNKALALFFRIVCSRKITWWDTLCFIHEVNRKFKFSPEAQQMNTLSDWGAYS